VAVLTSLGLRLTQELTLVGLLKNWVTILPASEMQESEFLGF
jgi:hypothetical protein